MRGKASGVGGVVRGWVVEDPCPEEEPSKEFSLGKPTHDVSNNHISLLCFCKRRKESQCFICFGTGFDPVPGFPHDP